MFKSIELILKEKSLRIHWRLLLEQLALQKRVWITLLQEIKNRAI